MPGIEEQRHVGASERAGELADLAFSDRLSVDTFSDDFKPVSLEGCTDIGGVVVGLGGLVCS
jgi:hypothetical protein